MATSTRCIQRTHGPTLLLHWTVVAADLPLVVLLRLLVGRALERVVLLAEVAHVLERFVDLVARDGAGPGTAVTALCRSSGTTDENG